MTKENLVTKISAKGPIGLFCSKKYIIGVKQKNKNTHAPTATKLTALPHCLPSPADAAL
jgi:hypothetical protein